ncbi:MAG: hypothetical protein JWM76_2461 [Pseudonocardiales bacterium]|nr:hypothetical protein [Pseudonocardiales bacterium]
MKTVATGLLLVAAVVFVVTVIFGDGNGAWGYVQAMAEAAMVGGLADWFAVTALFRHPLGIPIPHTAIIPRKKDQIGASLGTFVQENFLTEELVVERIAAAQVSRRVGDWLADPAHAARLTDEAATALNAAAQILRDEDIRAAVATFAEKRLDELDPAPLLARLIEIVVDGGQHQDALTSGVRAVMRFLDDNRPTLRERLSQESPEWIPNWVDDRVFMRLFSGIQSFLADIVSQPDHEFRRQYDARLRAYAAALRTDPRTQARVAEAKAEILAHPAVRSWIGSLWFTVKESLLASAADPGSELRKTVQSLVVQVGTSLRDDLALQTKTDEWLHLAVSHLIRRYAGDISELISGTVARWDADETSRRLELQVGRDLQFIRVNGTVVGALVGLLIHVVSQFL